MAGTWSRAGMAKAGEEAVPAANDGAKLLSRASRRNVGVVIRRGGGQLLGTGVVRASPRGLSDSSPEAGGTLADSWRSMAVQQVGPGIRGPRCVVALPQNDSSRWGSREW